VFQKNSEVKETVHVGQWYYCPSQAVPLLSVSACATLSLLGSAATVSIG